MNRDDDDFEIPGGAAGGVVALHRKRRAAVDQTITAALNGDVKLRVLRLGNFYGEAPTFEDALALLADDIRAGGRDYAEVYGKLVPHYLTGSSAASSDFDRALLSGNEVDAWREGADVVATLGGPDRTGRGATFAQALAATLVPAESCVREEASFVIRDKPAADSLDRSELAKRLAVQVVLAKQEKQ